jgi:thiamine-phosphate pyrophosphorylase
MVTDSRVYRSADGAQSDSDLAAAAAAAAGRAARGGVDLVQIRERSFEPVTLLDLIARVRQATDTTRARVVVNDRVDVALAGDADGVHLPAAAPPCHRVRTLVPEGFLIGRSVHSVAEALAAEEAGGCDYLIFGTVYESTSKPAGHPVAGRDELARVCRSVRLPVLAIGGITIERIADVAAAGAAGIAAIGLFASGAQADLAHTVGRIRQAFGHP